MTFDEIYAKYKKYVLKYILFKIKDQMVAEELAADVMVKIYKKLNTFNSELSTIKTWIINIAKHTMIDYMRKKQLSVVSLNCYYQDDEGNCQMDYMKSLTESDLNPEDQMISNEISRTMYNKFESLSETDKTVAALHFFDGLSYNEVAEQLKMPIGTVKAKLHTSRKIMTNIK